MVQYNTDVTTTIILILILARNNLIRNYWEYREIYIDIK